MIINQKINTMKKSGLFLVVLFVASIVLSSCGKYDEGPSISLRSKAARLTGVWKITKQTYNGTAVTLSADDLATTLEYKKDETFTMTTQTYGPFNGTWKFSDDKTQLITSLTFGGLTSSDTVNILRLTNKELFVEQVDGTDKMRSEYAKD